MNGTITKRSVDNMEPESRDTFLWDSELRGFGLKVTPKGNRVYLLQYRFGGRIRRYTIGKHGSPWTPESARREASRLLREVAAGKDPGAAKAQWRVDQAQASTQASMMHELTVWKYEIPPQETFTLNLPQGAKILHFAEQGKMQYFIWALVDPDSRVARVPIDFYLVGTGHSIAPKPGHALEYIGTVIGAEEPGLVFHLLKGRPKGLT